MGVAVGISEEGLGLGVVIGKVGGWLVGFGCFFWMEALCLYGYWRCGRRSVCVLRSD